MAPSLAWIGLGNMGRGMCKNLVQKGNLDRPLIIYNRTTKRASELSSSLPAGKSLVAESIKEVVEKSSIIFTCVGDDKAIEETIDTALEHEVRGKLFVDCSTVHPDTTALLEKKIHSKGAEFVACPVFGAPAMADAGQLICVLAGPEAAVAKVEPYTKGVIGRATIDFRGQAPSKATLMKVIGNTFILNMVEMLAEGHVLAEKSELGVENLQKFLEIMFPAPYMAYSKRLSTGDYYGREEPLFAVNLARKDSGHALNIAKSSGARMRAVELADEHLGAVQKHEGSRGDLAGIYGVVREESGMQFGSK